MSMLRREYQWGGECRMECDIICRLLVGNVLDVQVDGRLSKCPGDHRKEGWQSERRVHGESGRDGSGVAERPHYRVGKEGRGPADAHCEERVEHKLTKRGLLAAMSRHTGLGS